MRRRLGITVVLLCLVFGGGYLLYDSISSVEETPQTEPVPVLVKKVENPPVVQPDASVEIEPVLRIRTILGKVERQKTNGDWVRVSSGEEVPMSEAIRTEVDASATVKLGDTEIQLPGESKVSVESRDGVVSNLRLHYGRASVQVKGNEELRMRFDGSDAEAAGVGASFTGQNSGDGYLSLSSEDGVVELVSAGQAVQIPEGYQSVVRPLQGPSKPKKLPGSFFLKVRRPRVATRDRRITITGTTTPGALVRIKGVIAHADEDGKFSLGIPLREGANSLEVVASDILGRKGTRSLPSVQVDSKAPKVDGQVDW